MASISVVYIGIMEDFSDLDEEYDNIFITQEPSNDNVVSLEDNVEYKTVRDEKYSDISDF